ncbi:MAG: hypothetical protein RI947_587 [Candidatus Parcubacteria bacterium]|jgi:hypothetical protein
MVQIAHRINLTAVLPSYLLVFFTPWGFGVFLMCLAIASVLTAVYQYFRIKRTLLKQYLFLEITPAYNSIKTAFSTNQLFNVIHSVHSPSSFLDRFLKVRKTISFEIVSTKELGIRYILRICREDVATVKKSLRAYVPSIEIAERGDYMPVTRENLIIKEMKLSRPYVFPLQEQTLLNEFDPIAYLTAQMTKLDRNELIALQIVSIPVSVNTHSAIIHKIETLKQMILNNEDVSRKINTGIVWFLLNIFYRSKKKRLNELSGSKQLQYKAMEGKINQPIFETAIRLVVQSEMKEHRHNRMKDLVSTFDVFTSPSQRIRLNRTLFSYLKTRLLDKIRYYMVTNRLVSPAKNLILSSSEMSSLYHFPFNSISKTEDLIQNKSPRLPSPLSFKQSNNELDIIFADNVYGETSTPIGLTLEERRRHMYVIGATGTGKTTLLLSMIYKDILHGKGVAVLDPHGDLAERLIGVVPKERLQDIVYFNPYDSQYPIGLNVLELNENISDTDLNREKDLIVSSLISVFHKLYPARFMGPRMEHVLRNTVLTALEVENPTLFTVYKLLTNVTYRKKVVKTLEDPILKDFWVQEFEKLGSFQKAELISPITNKLGRFLTTSMTRNILNQPKSSLNFEKIMNSGKILICDLSKGKIGEDTSSFLGSLIIAKIQLAALNRVHIPMENRADFFLYIDEFQNFATMTFAQILSEARKYRLNTILAHQTVSQIEDKDLLKVILANVGTVISFRTSNPSDEDIVLPLFTPHVQKNEISNLPSYNFYIKINALIPQDAFTGISSPFSLTHDNDVQQFVISHSRRTYGQKRESISHKKNDKTKVKGPQVLAISSLDSTKKVRIAI